MKRHSRKGLIWWIVPILALLILAAGAWYFWSSRSVIVRNPGKPLLVDILQPSSGLALNLGDTLPVSVQAVGDQPITSLALWMDGQSLASQAVQGQPAQTVKFTWTWQAASSGTHVFIAQATDSQGETGQSSESIVYVAQTGHAPNTISAPGGASLDSIAKDAGISIGDLSGANPGLDPNQPLTAGTPINLPVPQGVLTGAPDVNSLPPTGPATGTGYPAFITAKFSTDAAVDKAYCYQSNGDGVWQRTPAGDFNFIQGSNGPIQLLSFQGQEGDNWVIQLECWGWEGGELKPLGTGKVQFDPSNLPNELAIAGSSFTVTGTFPPMKPLGGGGMPPSPKNLRLVTDAYICASHFGKVLAKLVCDQLLNSPIKEYNVVVWDWVPGTCWPGLDCPWINNISGFRIYEIPDAHASILGEQPIKVIDDPAQTAAAIPLPWGGSDHCYVVTAYFASPVGNAFIESVPSNVWCPSGVENTSTYHKILIGYPSETLITTAHFFDIGCDSSDPGTEVLNLKDAEMLVGLHIEKNGDCLSQHYFAGAVKFDLSSLQGLNQVSIQKAALHFGQGKSKLIVGEGIASNWGQPLCATDLGVANVDWSGWDRHQAALDKLPFLGAKMTPYQSIGPWLPSGINVTGIVDGWIHQPDTNNGFVLNANQYTLESIGILDTGSDVQECWNHLDGFGLEIEYYDIP
jgi:Bacterial Ig domain